MVVALAALFFAVGGSAFALGQKTSPQARCATGAIKGIAYVTGDPHVGLANISGTWSSASALFGSSFNCTGGKVEVKGDEATNGGTAFDVRFDGNPGTIAIGSPVTGAESAALAVTRLPDGSFRVAIGGAGPSDSFVIRNNIGFVIVLI
jgi:hypothetical protein